MEEAGRRRAIPPGLDQIQAALPACIPRNPAPEVTAHPGDSTCNPCGRNPGTREMGGAQRCELVALLGLSILSHSPDKMTPKGDQKCHPERQRLESQKPHFPDSLGASVLHVPIDPSFFNSCIHAFIHSLIHTRFNHSINGDPSGAARCPFVGVSLADGECPGVYGVWPSSLLTAVAGVSLDAMASDPPGPQRATLGCYSGVSLWGQA